MNKLHELYRKAPPGPWSIKEHAYAKHDTYWEVVDANGEIVFDDGSATGEYNAVMTTDTRDLILALYEKFSEK